MLGWRRVVLTNDDLHLGQNFASGGFVSADEVECTSSLTVEAHDLSEGLGDDHLEALVKEKSKALSILVEVTSHETLVGSVKEWVELLLAADVSDDLPLLDCWVHTSWVVGTGMEENARSWGGILKISDHTIEVKSLGLLVEVSVWSHIESSSLENGTVVAPGWSRNVNWSWSELVEEVGDDSQSTST